MVFRPEDATDDYQRRVETASGVPATSLAAVPLRSGDVTTGILGFVKFGDRHWSTEEINALRAVAALFAQLQARIVAENKLRYLAHHDELTGLLNRRALIAHLDARLQSGAPGPVAVLFIDLDRLKAINDSLGHFAGDEFIRVFAGRLRAALQDTDTLARLGGDEFVVVPAAPMDDQAADALAQRIRTATRERVGIANTSLARTVSFGVAIGRPGVDTSAGLLKSADLAMLSAKAGGGDAVAVFTTAMARRSELRNDIELHLHEVTTSGQLFLDYLPEFDLRTRRILATEALVRWHHPHLGLLPPTSFIGVAESLNLAGELGRWVLRTACADFHAWRSRGAGRDDTTLRINVSPGELVDEFGLTPDALCLKITKP